MGNMAASRCTLIAIIIVIIVLTTQSHALRSLPASPQLSSTAASTISSTTATSASGSSSISYDYISGLDIANLPAGWFSDGAADDGEMISIVFSLESVNGGWLLAQFHAVSDPDHDSYAQYLTAEEILAATAPPLSERQEIVAWLSSGGIMEIDDVGDAIITSSDVRSYAALFDAAFIRITNTMSNQTAVRATGSLRIPSSVNDIIEIAFGLSDIPAVIKHSAIYSPQTSVSPQSTHHNMHLMGGGCYNYLSYTPVVAPDFLAQHYNYTSRAASTTPVNSSISVIGGFGYYSYSPSSLSYYGSYYLNYAYPFTAFNIGRSVNTSADFEELEASLDIDCLFFINPTSQNYFYRAQPDDGTLIPSLYRYRQLASPPSVLSISYVFAESDLTYNTYAYRNTSSGIIYNALNKTDTLLIQLGLMGVTVVVSSGDWGTEGFNNTGCQNRAGQPSSNVQGPMLPSYPAGSPYVLTVSSTDFLLGAGTDYDYLVNITNATNYGANTFVVNSPYMCNNEPERECILCQANAYGEQATNLQQASGFTGGGGFNQYTPRPSWQDIAVTTYFNQSCTTANNCTLPNPSYYNAGNRAFPDVAIYGGKFIVSIEDESGQPPDELPVDGTSVSAPLFAAVIGRLNEVAMALTGKTLGFIAPLLYRMAYDMPQTFHDITVGDNIYPIGNNGGAGCSGFYAAPGWDPVTGLGSPNVGNMISYISSHPAFIGNANLFPTTIQGDPQITGFNKQSFQVHGISGHSYNIISTRTLQFNAEFIFLSDGRCPDELAARTECYGHPGTYIRTAVIRVNDGHEDCQDEVIITVKSGALEAGFTVDINGEVFAPSNKAISFGGTEEAPLITVTMDCAFVIVISTLHYTIRLDNSDRFLNQQVNMRKPLVDYLKKYTRTAVKAGARKRDVAAATDMTLPHGLLGQTWSTKTYANKWKHIIGAVENYQLTDGISGIRFEYNRYRIPNEYNK